MVSYVPLQHPFTHARLAFDPETAARKWQSAHHEPWLDPITATPQARWVNGPHDLPSAGELARQAKRTHRLAVFVAYYIPNRGCSADGGGAANRRDYLHWIDGVVSALGGTRTVVVLEPDALAADCFNATRAAELAEATRRLAKAGHYVYLDAGHPRWRSTGEMAERLLESGIGDAEGFSVNVSNRQTTRDSYVWGRELSDLVGNREFVIDTSRNGLGPPPEGQWCNVTKQALGQRPTTRPHLPGVAALLWIKRPGESDGLCGGERTYGFSPRQAERLIENARWVPEPVLAALPDR